MLKLETNNQTKYRIPRKKMNDILVLTKKMLKKSRKQDVSLAFVSSATIKKLNKQYRRKNQVTDVLSFIDNDWPAAESGDNYLGEIIICPQRAKAQARELNHSFTREVCRLALHGYLHLNDYDHIKAKEAKKMEALEEKIMLKVYG